MKKMYTHLLTFLISKTREKENPYPIFNKRKSAVKALAQVQVKMK